jgi:hypothetical protein
VSISAKVDWHGDEIDDRVEAAAGQGLRLGAEHVLQKSREVVPLEEGTLERSGTASQEGLEAAVSYNAHPYDVIQHERLDFRHANGRTAKYLEGPLNAERDTVGEIIATQLRRALE